jgi:hypothetical protein
MDFRAASSAHHPTQQVEKKTQKQTGLRTRFIREGFVRQV